jgi:hypothetical protein
VDSEYLFDCVGGGRITWSKKVDRSFWVIDGKRVRMVGVTTWR